MAIIRNTAGQGVYVRAIDSTGAATTTGVTCQVSLDGGAESAAATGASHVGGALWWQPLSQAETDAGTLAVRPDATDIVPDPVGIVTSDAAVSSRAAPGAAMALVANAVGDAEWNVSEVLADLIKWRGTQPSTLSGTYPQVRTEAGAEIASAAQIDNLTNNTLSDLRVPKVVERPDSGTEAYVVRLHTYDLDGSMLDPDSAPTLALENAAGTDLSTRLNSTTGTKVETGVYTWTYTASDSDDVPEQLVWEFTVVVSGATRKLPATSLVVDTTAVDFTSSDRTKLEAVHGKLPTGDIADESTAADAKTAAEAVDDRATEARLVKLDVSGTLAHSDAAAEYKATGFATPGDAMTLTSDERLAIKAALEVLGGKLDTVYRGRSRIREDGGVWYWEIIDGNGDVAVSLVANEAVGHIPAFDRVGPEPNA